MTPTRTVYISIGNSDGKLTQQEWEQFRDLTHPVSRAENNRRRFQKGAPT